MKKLKLIAMTFILFSSFCKRQEIVEIKGEAQNLKEGAVVISEKDKYFYYLDGMYRWEDSIVGKRIKVKGVLLIKETPPIKPGEPPKQQIGGIKRFILTPKWEFIKK
ncbi:MAG: hypothetical protein HY252_14065 [Sphingobacteriales bacterium]|nr:hypothetical protein [Sphingobacteriales bacterium]